MEFRWLHYEQAAMLRLELIEAQLPSESDRERVFGRAVNHKKLVSTLTDILVAQFCFTRSVMK